MIGPALSAAVNKVLLKVQFSTFLRRVSYYYMFMRYQEGPLTKRTTAYLFVNILILTNTNITKLFLVINIESLTHTIF